MIKNILVVLPLIISICLASMSVRVDTDSHLLYNTTNGARLVYHGVNVVYKLAPYYPNYTGDFDPSTSFNEEDVQNLHKWGFNVVRLYIAWQGTEPEDSTFSIKYIQNIQQIVKMCKKYNIAVFLDMHQDLFSSYFCGEGIPNWAVQYIFDNSEINTFPEPFETTIERDSDNMPNLDDCHKQAFFTYYLTKDVNTLSQDFMTNVEQLSDKFATFWKFVAENFQNNNNILGYELLNEPWGGSFYENTLSELMPRNNNDNFLLPFYQKLNEAIRSVDEETLVFFEPIVLDFINQGFSTNVGGKEYQDREVYSYHIYCPFVNGTGAPVSQIGCRVFDDYQSKGNQKNYEEIGITGFLTEFGALDNTEASAKEIRRLTGNAGKIFNSWTYWQYKYFNDITTANQNPDSEGFYNSDGTVQETKVKALSEPYGYSYCGIPVESTFNYNKISYIYKVKVDSSICNPQSTQSNLMFINTNLWFTNGYTVKWHNCDADNCSLNFVSFDATNKYGYLTMETKLNLQDGTEWGVTITASS